MKKIVALVLSFVMILSFAVPSFALASDDQANALKTGWGSTSSAPSYPNGYSSSWFYIMLYHTYQIRSMLNNIDSDTGNMLIKLTNIASDISSIELDVADIQSGVNTIKNNSTSILTAINNVVSYVDELETSLSSANTILSSILSDTDMLQQVLANQDDLDFKNSQKGNQSEAEKQFFDSRKDLSVKPSDFTYLSDLFGGVLGSYNFKEYIGDENPLSLMGEGSAFMSFFSDETGKAINPDFTGSNNGVDAPPPVEPPQFVSPNILRSESYTSWNKNTIFNTFGYNNNRAFQFFSENLNIIDGDVYNFVVGNSRLITPDIDFNGQALTGYIPVTYGDEFFFYDVSFNGYFIVTGYDCDFYDDKVTVNELFYKSIYSTDFELDVNGVYSFVFDLWENESIDFVRFQVGSFSMDSVITRNEYPLPGGRPIPYSNLLPSALEFPGLNSVLGENGIYPGYTISGSSYDTLTYVTSTNLNVTGFMPFYIGRSIYLSSDLITKSNFGAVFIDSVSHSYTSTVFYVSSLQQVDGFYVITPDLIPEFSFTPNYFCLKLRTFTPDSIISYSLPPASVSTFALRSYSEPVFNDEVVTSYVSDRQKQFEFLVGGGS